MEITVNRTTFVFTVSLQSLPGVIWRFLKLIFPLNVALVDFSIGKQEFKMAAQVSQVCTADDILGPFGTCEKVVLKKVFCHH